jgi:hypothetical protein
MYERVEVQLHIHLISALDISELLDSRPGGFTLKKNPPVLIG